MHRPARPDPSFRSVLGLALGLVLACAACGEAQAPQDPTPTSGASASRAVEVLDPQVPDAPFEIDMGHLPYGEVARHTVHMRNASDRPLVVRSVRPGCSCTTPVLAYVDPASGKEVRANARGRGDLITIPPGLPFEMQLAVDSTVAPAKNQHKIVVVRMTTDSEVEPYLTFNLRVFIESHFQPSPAVLDLREVSVHGGGAGTLTLASDGNEGRRVLEVQSSPRDLLIGLSERSEGAANLWDLRVQVLPPVAVGPQDWTVELATSGPNGEGEGPPLRVSVRAEGVPDISVEPAIVLLDATPVGQPAANQARLITRLAGQRLLVRSARIEGDLAGVFEVEATPQRPDDDGRSPLWTLRLIARAEQGATPASGRLIVELDDPEQPAVEARLHFRP
jgi:hypothetical protein